VVKPDVVRRKVVRATTWLEDAESILSRPPEQFLADTQSQDLASFYLFLAIQESIGLVSESNPAGSPK
jgi:hypothetical protein